MFFVGDSAAYYVILPVQPQDLVLHQFPLLLLMLQLLLLLSVIMPILTKLGHNKKCINAHLWHDQFVVKGYAGVKGVMKVILSKILFLIQITWYGPVTHAYSSAKYPLQKLSAQISIWGHLRSQGSKDHFHQKCYFSYILHFMVLWLMYIHQLDTPYKNYCLKFKFGAIWGHWGQKVTL